MECVGAAGLPLPSTHRINNPFEVGRRSRVLRQLFTAGLALGIRRPPPTLVGVPGRAAARTDGSRTGGERPRHQHPPASRHGGQAAQQVALSTSLLGHSPPSESQHLHLPGPRSGLHPPPLHHLHAHLCHTRPTHKRCPFATSELHAGQLGGAA